MLDFYLVQIWDLCFSLIQSIFYFENFLGSAFALIVIFVSTFFIFAKIFILRR